MEPMEPRFRDVSFVKAKLFAEPIYRADDAVIWNILRTHFEEVRGFFHQIGQEVVLDEGEGYAFVKQIEPVDDERVPRLVQARPLSYELTFLLICLREELDRFDASGSDSGRLVLTREQLRMLIEPYIRATSDAARRRDRIDTAINKAVEFGFLRLRTGETQQEDFQVMRIIKARFGPSELSAVKNRLISYGQQRQA